MIAPNTPIQIVNPSTGEFLSSPVDNIFQKFSLYIDRNSYCKDNYHEPIIIFPKHLHIKISDFYGWTDIISIKRIDVDNDNKKWISLNVNRYNIDVLEDTIIPCFDTSAPIKGFHGSIEYPYMGIPANILPTDVYNRVHRGKSPKGTKIDYAHPMVTISPHKHHYAYIINTKSKFYNANHITLNGINYIPNIII